MRGGETEAFTNPGAIFSSFSIETTTSEVFAESYPYFGKRGAYGIWILNVTWFTLLSHLFFVGKLVFLEQKKEKKIRKDYLDVCVHIAKLYLDRSNF